MRARREQMATKSGEIHRRTLLYGIFHPQSRCLPNSAGGRGMFLPRDSTICHNRSAPKSLLEIRAESIMGVVQKPSDRNQ